MKELKRRRVLELCILGAIFLCGCNMGTSNTTGPPPTPSPTPSPTPNPAHHVDLNWGASTSVVIGYNVYRSSQSGGPYQPLNPSVVVSASYTDSNVQSGQRYFYVVTAVDSSGGESVFSNEAAATVP